MPHQRHQAPSGQRASVATAAPKQPQNQTAWEQQQSQAPSATQKHAPNNSELSTFKQRQKSREQESHSRMKQLAGNGKSSAAAVHQDELYRRGGANVPATAHMPDVVPKLTRK